LASKLSLNWYAQCQMLSHEKGFIFIFIYSFLWFAVQPNQGIPIWGLSIQNEPLARQKWESCIYTANEERDFLKSYLGPTLQKHQLGRLKIIAWDHNRDFIF